MRASHVGEKHGWVGVVLRTGKMQTTVFDFDPENTGGIRVLEVVDCGVESLSDNPLAMRYRQLLGAKLVHPGLLSPVPLGERLLKGTRHQGFSWGNR